MGFNLMELKEISVISCLAKGADDKDDVLKFFCHDHAKNVSYREYLSESQFVERIKKLNRGVEVPTNVARSLLSSVQPIQAKLLSTVKTDPDEDEYRIYWQHQEDRGVLCLDYRIEGTQALFKWQWHLVAQFSSILTFYRYLLKHAQNKVACLSQNQQLLLDVIKKKDIELKQCRLNGVPPTVATDPFDVDAFNEQNKHLLTSGVHSDSLSFATTAPKIKNEVENSPDGNRAVKVLNPRNRRRKAMDVIFDETKGDRQRKDEVEEGPKTIEPCDDTDSDTELPAYYLRELSNIKRSIEKTAAQTKKLFDEYNIT